MSFTERTTGPARSGTKYWHTDNPFYPAYGMPNCTAYAWGRFYEILGEKPKLYTGNAGTWYNHTEDGYKRGKEPALGAVICFSRPGDAGHVAVVEKINSDGSIVTSDSGWGSSNWWWRMTRTPPRYNNDDSGLVFQGFIYNPAASNASNVTADFISAAQSQIGKDGTWSWKTSGLSRGQPWCAAFVVSCAKSAGILGKLIPVTYGAGEIPKQGVKKGWGEWHAGPYWGTTFKPQSGDIVLFRWDDKSSYSGQDKYYSDHVGIVEKFEGTRVTTIEGNSGSGDSNYARKVCRVEYTYTSTCINGYYRPDWAKCGGSAAGLGSGYYSGPLYDYENTKQDAIIREIGYVNSAWEPSINSSNIRLSAVNYTALFSALFDAGKSSLGGYEYQASDIDMKDTDAVAKEIVKFCMSKGMNVAGGIGIVANINGECGLDISLSGTDSNGLTSGGMCMWNGANWKRFLEYCGPDWKTNLTKQCEFLFYFMEHIENGFLNYQVRRYYGTNCSLLEYLCQVPNTEAGAIKATEIFVYCYENPADPAGESQRRGKYASEFWKKLSPILKKG